MAAHIHILGISGSLRRGSFNTALLRNAQAMLPEDVSLEIADLSGIPLFNQDHEHEPPEAVRAFKAKIAGADALLFAVPEYNYSIPGVLKNAIDWASRPYNEQPFNGKPAAIMGAGGRFGTVRAQLHFRQIASYLNLLVLPRPELMVPLAHQKFDADGVLTDQDARDQLKAVVNALVEWTRRLG
ncbi:MAG: NAD(P)H-dependent oxidoreductase [Anaerolineae bacterium]|nr:NAD(P)H-dependent oxidoreductase [Candidatus Roseilinea sp.]MDW8451779.1 NAD(P)H-dependent oxidoreductase [Anaerolineae bacterium]